MLRSAFIVTALGLSSLAQAVDVAELAHLDVMPVARTSSSPFDALAPLISAKAQFERGDYDASYKNYSAVILHDPNNIQVLFGLADSALALGKSDIAARVYTKLASYDLNAEQSIAQFSGLVLAEISAGTSESPEARLKQALKLSPNNFKLWNALGQLYDSEQRWTESFIAYQTAAKNGFSQAGLHNNLGMSFLSQKKYEGAQSHFKFAVKLAPHNAQFENNYRFSLLMSGEYRAALENINDAAAGALLSDAGFIAMQREEYVLARLLLEKAVEVSPHYNERAVQNLKALEARDN